jgi:hypothetical protein
MSHHSAQASAPDVARKPFSGRLVGPGPAAEAEAAAEDDKESDGADGERDNVYNRASALLQVPPPRVALCVESGRIVRVLCAEQLSAVPAKLPCREEEHK